jgi:zona occludens toxin
MAISVYSGVMGSGKSYECIKSVILPAVQKGRRVVTNISGIDEQKIHEYLIDKGAKAESLGQIIRVSNERISEANFFTGEAVEDFKFEIEDWIPAREFKYYSDAFAVFAGKNLTKTRYQLILAQLIKLRDQSFDIGSCLVEAAEQKYDRFDPFVFASRPRGEVFAALEPAADSIVQPGDLVVVDEAWRFWAESCKLSAEHMNFFRMHRHYASESGQTCDLVVVIQDFASLHRFLRGVCELVLIFYKLKALGLMSRYRYESYEGRPRKATRISSSTLIKYDPSIFPLYQSYDSKNAKETSTDDRQNLFKSKPFVITMLLAVSAFIFFGWKFSSIIAGYASGKPDSKPNGSGSTALQSSQPTNTKAPSPAKDALVSSPSLPSFQSDGLRLIGYITQPNGETVLLIENAGRITRRVMNGGLIDGWQTLAVVDGEHAQISFSHNQKAQSK